MSDVDDAPRSSQIKNAGKNIGGVGAVGGFLLAGHSKFVVENPCFDGLEEPIKVLVPFVSVVIFTIGAWVLNYFKPQSSEYYVTRRRLNNAIDQYDKALENPDLNAEQRTEIQSKRHRLVVLKIESLAE